MTSTASQAQSLPPKAVLFDSGGVLMQPVGGPWNPRADFEPTVLQRAPQLSRARFAEAIAAGDRFMASPKRRWLRSARSRNCCRWLSVVAGSFGTFTGERRGAA
jgi:hypothetical protein